MKLKLLSLSLIALVFLSCGENTEKKNSNYEISGGKADTLKYAKGFSITNYDNFKLLKITNPWQGAQNIKLEYLLYKDETPSPYIFPEAIRIKTPISKIVCMSTSHIGFLDALGELQSIVGIANQELIYNKTLQNRITNHEILDMGYEKNLNYELLLTKGPDIIMSYSIGSELAGVKSKLQELGLSMVLNAEYLEAHPLGKAEWIKFIAAFYGKEDDAKMIFDEIEKEYNYFKSLTVDIENKPTVLIGLPWKGTWYISGGQSFAAKLISDAGGNFLWKDNTSHEALGLSIETVYDIAADADIWINTGYGGSYDDLLKTDERIEFFKAYREKSVFNNDNRLSKGGGNDYWESGIVKPQYILKDLIKIFHPDLLQDSTFTYYNELK